MKVITVGAFEAKTHLAQLLTEVEHGAEVRITRRGKLVAVMHHEGAAAPDEARRALERLSGRRGSFSREEIRALMDEGRER